MAERWLWSFAIKPGDKGPNGTVWNEVVSVGTRFSPWLEENPEPVTTTPEMLDQFVANFRDPLPIDVEHARFDGSRNPEEIKARGWIEAVERVGDKLMAAVEWTTEGAGWIADKAFRRISIEFGQGQGTDNGDPRGWFLAGASLTNHPFWNVPDLALSVRSYRRFGTDAGGGESSQPQEIPSVPTPTPVAQEEESMSDEIKALEEQLAEKEAEIAALSVKVAELESFRADAAKADEDKAIALALEKGAIKNEDDEIADARKVYALGVATFDRLVLSRAPVVKTEPRGAGRPDTSKPEAKPVALSRVAAGEKLHTLTRERMAEKGETYPIAFAAVRADDANQDAVQAYEEV